VAYVVLSDELQRRTRVQGARHRAARRAEQERKDHVFVRRLSPGSESKQNNGFGGLDALERRAMFDGAPAVPVQPPIVLDMEFHFETAPHAVKFTFSSDVWASLDGSDLVIMNELGRLVIPPEVITVNWEAATNTASFEFVRFGDGVLPDGVWHATLLGEGVTDARGFPLDGDGDELPGGNFERDFFTLTGDANRDARVDLRDLNILAQNFGNSGTFSKGDFNYDGRVDMADFGMLPGRFGHSIHHQTQSPTGSSLFGTSSIGSTDAPLDQLA
jgi:hypothetical protein